MNIAFVSDAIYPYNKGGKEKRLYEMSTRLAKMGHEVHIYTMHWWKSAEMVRQENGVTLIAISKYHPMYREDKRSIKEGIMFSLACFKLFSVKFDVLDVDQMPFFPVFTTWIVCKLRGKRLYCTWHEALTTKDWVSYMGVKGYIAATIERMCIKLPYKITAASSQTQEMLASYHKRTKRIDLVPSGIDISAIGAVKPTKVDCDVLYVGRFVKDKNVDKLIKAIAIVANKYTKLQCVIIGHGIEKPKLQKLVTKLGLDECVTIQNPLVNHNDIFAYMKKAKVFVLPSVREGFGIVALEALACGTPVVTIDAKANAAKQFISENKSGSIVKLGAEPLADAITKWLDKDAEPYFADTMAEHDWSRLAARQEEVYV